MITRRASLVVALTTFGAAALLVSVSAQSPAPLFTLDPAGVPDAASPNARGLRVSPEAIEQLRERVLGGELPAALFNFDAGLAFPAVFHELESTGRGYVLHGTIDDDPFQTAMLAIHGDHLSGDIYTRQGSWSLSGAVGRPGLVAQPHATVTDPRPGSDTVEIPEGVSGLPDIPDFATVPIRNLSPADRPTWVEPRYEVDFLVVYTRSAARIAGGNAGIEAWIDSRVSQVNRAFRNSGTPTRLRLTGTVPAPDYVADSNVLVHLAYTADTRFGDRTRPDPDGHLDWVHAVRAEHRADLVHLIYGSQELGNCGGYVNQQRFRRGSPGPRYPPVEDAWYTIMANPTQCNDHEFRCYQIPFFSNPSLTHFGDPGGVAGDDQTDSIHGPSDVARMLREYSHLISHNLRSNCLRSGSRIRLQAWTGGFVRAYHGGGESVLANSTSPGGQETFVVEHDSPECVESGDTIFLRTSSQYYLRAANGGGGVVDATSRRPEEWESFRVERLESDGLIRSIDDVALRAFDGSYLRVLYREEPARQVWADGPEVGPWEHFTLHVVSVPR